MEEAVGKIWHKFINDIASREYDDARVHLSDIEKSVGIFFRALGGDVGVNIRIPQASTQMARRSWLQRIAGSNKTIELCWLDNNSLYLPSSIAVFADKQLNHQLYLWLSAMATLQDDTLLHLPWLEANQQRCATLIKNYAGLAQIYHKLVQAHLLLRGELTPDDDCEKIIRHALAYPTSVNKGFSLDCLREIQPVYLWLNPLPPETLAAKSRKKSSKSSPKNKSKKTKEIKDQRQRRGERVDAPDGDKGLMAFRLESLFTWASFVKVDRTCDDEEDLDNASRALDDMEVLSISDDTQETSAARLRFELDLANAHAEDDEALDTQGILLPEWDYKHKVMRDNYCCLNPMTVEAKQPIDLPPELQKMARRLRQQFSSLIPERTWHRGQADGCEIDLDAYLNYLLEKKQGHAHSDQNVYRDFKGGVRDLSCLLLADLSMSTDAFVNNDARVIDIIQDSLMLFSEALTASGDAFSLYGFCSNHRHDVQYHQIKTFKQAYNGMTRARIKALKPSYYTRMGTAIRQATRQLSKQSARQRLLLLLTDGKPNDLDQYEGRYGVEDTRIAIQEAKQQGIKPFCVTIDEQAQSYLPHIFGNGGYVVIRNPAELPKELPLLYAQLTQR